MDFAELWLFLQDLETKSKRSLVIFSSLQEQQKVLSLEADNLYQNDQQKVGTLSVSIQGLHKKKQMLETAIEAFEQQVVTSKKFLCHLSNSFETMKRTHHALSSEVIQESSKTTDICHRAENAHSQATIDYQNAKSARQSLEQDVQRLNQNIRESRRNQENLQKDIGRTERQFQNLKEGDNGSSIKKHLSELKEQVNREQKRETRLSKELQHVQKKLTKAIEYQAECKEELRLCKEELQYQKQRVKDIRQLSTELQSFQHNFTRIDYLLGHLKGVLIAMSNILNEQGHFMNDIIRKLLRVDKSLRITEAKLSMQLKEIDKLMTQQIDLTRTICERQQIVLRSCQLLHHEMNLISSFV